MNYYLCGQQPDVIRLQLEECKPPSAIEREALTSIGVEQTERQLAETRQQLVSSHVTERVVVRLETVEIEQQKQ